MFVPIVLLIVGRWTDFDWLLAGAYFIAFPMLRAVFGSAADGAVTDWSDGERAFLNLLPRLFGGVLLITFAWILWTISSVLHEFSVESIGFMVSSLVMSGLAACVAHDLAHRSGPWDRRSAHLISALVGYPFFIFEHLEHHKESKATDSANCPRVDESVWSYTGRRFMVVPSQVFQRALAASASSASTLDRVWVYLCVTVAAWAAFIVAGGWYGAVFYGLLVVGVPFLLNTITYIQHWGLGDDGPIGQSPDEQIGWDDGCRFQSWMILNISFHRSHHASPSAPYYTYGPSASAPKLPAEYALMVMVCFVPALWRRVMTPGLIRWRASRDSLAV